MKNMINLSLIILTLASTATFAGGKAQACAKCGEMKQLEGEFNALNYFNKVDQEKGSGKSVKVPEYIELFEKNYKTKKSSPEEFQAMVTLVAASNPYDVETSGAAALAGVLFDSRELQNGFQNALSQVSEPCRKKDLEVYVDDYLCQFRKEKHLKPGQELNDACLPKIPFNIEQCLTGHAAASSDKKPVAQQKKSPAREPSAKSEN